MSNRNRQLYQDHSEALESSGAENVQAMQSAAGIEAGTIERQEIKSLRTANTVTPQASPSLGQMWFSTSMRPAARSHTLPTIPPGS